MYLCGSKLKISSNQALNLNFVSWTQIQNVPRKYQFNRYPLPIFQDSLKMWFKTENIQQSGVKLKFCVLDANSERS